MDSQAGLETYLRSREWRIISVAMGAAFGLVTGLMYWGLNVQWHQHGYSLYLSVIGGLVTLQGAFGFFFRNRTAAKLDAAITALVTVLAFLW